MAVNVSTDVSPCLSSADSVLGRAISEFPTVGQSDILQLIDTLVRLSPKDHTKAVRSCIKDLNPASSQSRLDSDTYRLERLNGPVCKTIIETFKLSNSKKASIDWKIAKPHDISPQHFISCTPSRGTLAKGKSVFIRVAIVLFTCTPVLDLVIVTCLSTTTQRNSYVPLLLHITPDHENTHPEPFWSIDFDELHFSAPPISAAPLPSSSTSATQSILNAISVPTRTPSGSVTVSYSTADLYGTKVFVKRWDVPSATIPPQACLDEIQTLRSLNHPSLITFIGGRSSVGSAYIITRYLENGTVEQALRSPKGDMGDLLKRITMVLDIAYGIVYLHGKGVIHRHLSTNNMMIDDKGKMKLTGIGQSSSNAITSNCYIAPEVASDHSKATTASDVFSFGVCLWEIASLNKPARSPEDLQNGVLPNLSCDVLMLPDFVELISICTDPKPENRPALSAVVMELESIRDTAAPRTPFHFPLSRNKTLKDRNIISLPRSLVYLDMASNVHLTDVSIADLPRKLQHLDLGMCTKLTDDCLDKLPLTLTYLDLSSNIHITDKGIKNLPRGLSFLSLRDNTNLTEQCIPDLPAALKSLNILNASHLAEACLPQFPKTLTEFHMPFKWIPAFADENIKLLPPMLATLNLQTNTTLTTTGLQTLPPTLRYLNLSANRSLDNACLAVLPKLLETLIIPHATEITDDGIESLPRTLQHLNMSGNKNLGQTGARNLPPALLSLNISSTQNVWDMSIKNFPRSITSLILSANKQLTDFSIRDLPPSLTELNMAGNKNLTDACVKHFPSSIKILNLSSNTGFTDACVRFLPRSLTDLNLSSNENFTDSCIPDFPRSLRYLYLKKTWNVTDMCIKYLPRSLTHLDMSGAFNLTNDCISDLPTSIMTLELWTNKNLSHDKLRARLPSMRVLALNVD